MGVLLSPKTYRRIIDLRGEEGKKSERREADPKSGQHKRKERGE
jgi:hypothetical protein